MRGLPVEGFSHLHELGQAHGRIGGEQQRTVAAAARALNLLLHGSLEVDRRATHAERGAVLGEEHGAAARGEHDARPARQVLDDLLLARPKARLAFLFEDEVDVDTGAAFDLDIAVDERPVTEPRERPADGRLAGAHRPYEEDAALSGEGRGVAGGRLVHQAILSQPRAATTQP